MRATKYLTLLFAAISLLVIAQVFSISDNMNMNNQAVLSFIEDNEQAFHFDHVQDSFINILVVEQVKRCLTNVKSYRHGKVALNKYKNNITLLRDACIDWGMKKTLNENMSAFQILRGHYSGANITYSMNGDSALALEMVTNPLLARNY